LAEDHYSLFKITELRKNIKITENLKNKEGDREISVENNRKHYLHRRQQL